MTESSRASEVLPVGFVDGEEIIRPFVLNWSVAAEVDAYRGKTNKFADTAYSQLMDVAVDPKMRETISCTQTATGGGELVDTSFPL